ncbi:MAG: GNAT family N-acetyltransferase [Anaerolineae bacterium]
MTVRFRQGTPDDYDAIAALATLTRPDIPVTADNLHYADSARDPKCKAGFIVALDDDVLCGYASFTQYIDIYHPQKFWMSVRVHPDHRRQGIGTALFQALLEATAEYQPIEFMAEFSMALPESSAFAEKHGFVLAHRRYESTLDVRQFDPLPWQSLLTRLESEGIRFASVAALADDPERDAKFHELQWLIDNDVPFGEEMTKSTLEQFRQYVINNPDFVPDGTFIALDGNTYVGLSSFFKNGESALYIDLTGSIRTHRRRGIATALKVLGIQYAQTHNYAEINVTNDDSNTGMMAINAQLGFRRTDGTLRYRKTFSPAL